MDTDALIKKLNSFETVTGFIADGLPDDSMKEDIARVHRECTEVYPTMTEYVQRVNEVIDSMEDSIGMDEWINYIDECMPKCSFRCDWSSSYGIVYHIRPNGTVLALFDF